MRALAPISIGHWGSRCGSKKWGRAPTPLVAVRRSWRWLLIVFADAFGGSPRRTASRHRLAEDRGSVRGAVLCAARGDDNAKLIRLLLEAAGPEVMPMSGVMQVARPSCRRPLALVVSPTRNAASPFGGSRAITIAFADPERAPEADADLLARLYGLTAREAAVASLLSRAARRARPRTNSG